MPVEITILSGQRQGDRIELAENEFDVGELATDAVRFDSAKDPGVKGRRASLRLEGGRWRIRSTGTSQISVNHDLVERSYSLRSGDIIRMSEVGPDFSFSLISRLSAATMAQSGETEAPIEAEPLTATTASTFARAGLSTESKPRPVQTSLATVAAVLAVVCVSLFAVMSKRSGRSALMEPPRLAYVPALSVDEGTELLWLPEVLNAEGIDGLSFSLSADKPEGMQIDRETGAIRWTPTEGQAPEEYKCQLELTWSHDSQEQMSTVQLFFSANEINQTPTLEPIAAQTLNLLQGDSLKLAVRATDSDQPTQSVTFQFESDVPSGMQIDVTSGRITWTPNDSHANKTVTVSIEVSDDGDPPMSTRGEFKVSVINPDPWEVAADKMRQALYLVGVQPTGSLTILPLGTACAISADTLLTTATVATGLEEGRQRGWRVVAISSTKLHDLHSSLLPITDLKAHFGYVRSEDPQTQIFFDLGLLRIDGQMETSCQLATAESVAELAVEPGALGCIGFDLDGGSLTRFDLPNIDLHRVELYSVIPLSSADGDAINGPPLLQLSGELLANPLGSPIITRDARIVGVYATQAALPDDAEPQHIHYAPVISLVSAWLSGDGQGHWVKPEPALTTPSTEETP